jgi:hypothetical protein
MRTPQQTTAKTPFDTTAPHATTRSARLFTGIDISTPKQPPKTPPTPKTSNFH